MNEDTMRIVLVTGGFDPIHSGHIKYLNEASKLGDKLVVGINSDAWLVRKKGRSFMSIAERRAIVGALKDVDVTMEFDDSDGSACSLLKDLQKSYPYATFIFANGGDRTKDNIPETIVKNVEFVFGVGGENKANSSSWLLEDWKAPKMLRPWGYYRVLHDVVGLKVKELTINPGQSLSMQRHQSRAEYWIVSEGTAILNSLTPDSTPSLKLALHAEYTVSKNEWHQLTNPYDAPCKIVEIQYGTHCVEDDIERKIN